MAWKNAFPAKVAGAALFALALAGCGQQSDGEADVASLDITIAGTRVFPESITSDAAGNIYVGSHGGTIYRAASGSASAEPWILPDEENGLASLFGVLVDEPRGLLWVCSNADMFEPPETPVPSALKAFDLKTGSIKASYDFPSGAPTACNDIAISADGSAYATETVSGGIFVLRPGAPDLSVFAAGGELVGVDGIAFAGDGTMYVNNVRKNLIQRVNINDMGGYAGLTDLKLSQPVSGPDALRPISGSLFLQAEGAGGKVTLVTVEGDTARIDPIRAGLESSAGVTRVGPVGYALEGKIEYLVDPNLAGQDPGEFRIRAFPMPEGL